MTLANNHTTLNGYKMVSRFAFAICALSLLSILAGAQARPAQEKSAHGMNPSANKAVGLRLLPQAIALKGPYTQTRVLAEAQMKSGEAQDVSGLAEIRLLDPKLALIDDMGIVRPRKDGETVLVARWQGKEARTPVHISGMAHPAPPQFLNDVIPVLTRAGCNGGACHGAASGKGGFKLSLSGYDPDADYTSITRGAFGRRVEVARPANSLLLRKPLLMVAHRGGKRLDVSGADYRLLRDWIAAGMPGPLPAAPTVTRLEVTPPIRTLGMGKTQRFAVQALFSDGSRHDVTPQTIFTASDETVATVTPGGEAKVTGNGEGAILVRYQGLVATARVISPYGPPRTDKGTGKQGDREIGKAGRESAHAKARPSYLQPAAALEGSRQIDALVTQKLNALGLEPSPLCSDTDFLRRATLDVTGRIPTPDEVRAFLSDADPQKRDKMIDTLLARPEYVDFWTLKWGDILRCSREKLTPKGMYAYHDWIRQSVADNKGWDQWARELVLANGSIYKNGAANFYRTAASPQELAETTSEVFLGVRIACARCHNHPYEKWTQNQYYQMTAFFARSASKPGERPGELVMFAGDAGETTHPRTKKIVAACALDATPVPDAVGRDRRQALADWLTAPQNPFFAHAVVNRIWRHYLGTGFVEPVDDLRITNPPSNAALYDWLAQDLARHHYDLKYLMRCILRSQTYQRSPEPTRNNARDSRFYSHFNFKRLGAEQMLDAIADATGIYDKFDNLPMGTRACELPDTSVASYFLDLFGRPARNVTCECERSEAPNLGQILHLMNDSGINGRLSAKTGKIAKLIEAKTGDAKLIEELYVSALSRFPTSDESRRAVQILTALSPAGRQKAAEDILWALLNSKEFVFNH